MDEFIGWADEPVIIKVLSEIWSDIDAACEVINDLRRQGRTNWSTSGRNLYCTFEFMCGVKTSVRFIYFGSSEFWGDKVMILIYDPNSKVEALCKLEITVNAPDSESNGVRDLYSEAGFVPQDYGAVDFQLSKYDIVGLFTELAVLFNIQY